ncbi:MAG: aspartate-alanine antiporter [Muribaculaceae bacterium]|nr:aspartate-alanine antiporter [Muribaculaceae bacterium]
MNFFFDMLREYPALALFLTVGLGFWLGRLKIGKFTLGPVTAVLIIGVIVGQLEINISSQIKTVFFMLFLFSIGYSVGPQFFRSLRGMGLKQVLFAVVMSACCFGATLGAAKLMAYNAGEAVGLFSGSQTCSSLMAVGSDAISKLPTPDEVKKQMLDMVPVCYAVTYIFGTLGTVIMLGTVGPYMLGGLDKVKEQTARLEAEMNEASWKSDPVNVNALRTVAFRAFRVEHEFFGEPRAVAEVEEYLRAKGKVLYVDRIRRADGTIVVGEPYETISQGDTVVACGRREFLMANRGYVGREVNDTELLEYPVERIPVLVTSRDVAGRSVADMRAHDYMRGVVIEELQRDASTIDDITPGTIIRKGDTLVLVGQKSHIRKASEHIGYVDVPSNKTDIMFLGLAIFIGAFLGAIPIVVKGIPLSFGISGGSLIGGMVFGWLRTRRPTVGYIPSSALWLMNNLGLNVFIAVVGIEAAPSFIAGIKAVGWMLPVVGAVATLVPLLIGLLMGRYLFKFNPALTLGCCAGTRTCTAALGAVQETLGSNLPTMGYTVTYAVSNILLVIWGIIMVALI